VAEQRETGDIMLRFLSRTLIAVAALVGMAGTANAAFVTWTDQVAGSNDLIGMWTSYSYQHDLTRDGFQPGQDHVDLFSLSINLLDDQDSWLEEILLPEAAFVNLPGFEGDSFVYNFGVGAYDGWSAKGVAELNNSGLLSVTITSLWGDFYFGGSKLVAIGESGSTQVPEPGTLAMFGLGLVGVAAAARRRKARAA
jgi:hypothetical protein